MKVFLNRLFHMHQYVWIESKYIETEYEGQPMKYHLLIQVCSICGKVKINKTRL